MATENLVLRALCPGDESALEAFLLPRLESSMFLIGNLRQSGLLDTGKRLTGTYVAAFEDGEIVGVVAHFWNGILVPQAPVHLDRLWRAALRATGRSLSGLSGPWEQVAAISGALGLDEGALQMNECERLYTLSLDALQVPEALRLGRVAGRRVAAQDVDILARWRVAYEVEALGESDTPDFREQQQARARAAVEGGVTWILEADGRPVATSAFNAYIREAVQIGGVWTPPELRGRGYARCVVAQSLLDVRAEGTSRAILFTGEHNIAAQKAYTSLGFRRIGDYGLVLLREALEPAQLTKEEDGIFH